MTKSFNINSNVRVKLTEQGKKLLERDHNEFWSSHGKLDQFPYKPHEEDENGYVKFQLWSLMYQLGKYCILGCEPPFDTVILIDDAIERLAKKYQAQKLYNILIKYGYADDVDEILDLVEKWLPEPQSAAGSQNVNTELLVEGFNHCLDKMKVMLR